MFTANGRFKKNTQHKTQAMKKGKEFICTVCNKRKTIANVEFGEYIFCECGGVMVEFNND